MAVLWMRSRQRPVLVRVSSISVWRATRTSPPMASVAGSMNRVVSVAAMLTARRTVSACSGMRARWVSAARASSPSLTSPSGVA